MFFWVRNRSLSLKDVPNESFCLFANGPSEHLSAFFGLRVCSACLLLERPLSYCAAPWSGSACCLSWRTKRLASQRMPGNPHCFLDTSERMPDKNPNDPEAAQKFIAIMKAWGALMSPRHQKPGSRRSKQIADGCSNRQTALRCQALPALRLGGRWPGRFLPQTAMGRTTGGITASHT